jgi:hypothetical protein
MTRTEVEAVAKVLWLQTDGSNVLPFPEAGDERENLLKRAREIIYALQSTRSPPRRHPVGHHSRLREANE